MCGRFYLDVAAEELARVFELPEVPDLLSRYNIAPSQSVGAVRVGAEGREWVNLYWGLIPFWAKDKKFGYRTINARAESVESKPAFRAAFKSHRCIIPSSGFYEWQTLPDGKQPYCLHPTQGGLFAFAGLYEHWEGEDDEVIDSCTIIVTEANAVVSAIHDRMPVILPPAAFSTWLDPALRDPARLKPLLAPYPAEAIATYPVSRRVNNPRNDDPTCLAPLAG